FSVDWNLLHAGEEKHRVVGLPCYPFAVENYWFNTKITSPVQAITKTIEQKFTLQDTIIQYLKIIFAEKLKLSPDKIATDETYEVYGVESLLVLEITKRLEQELGTLPKTLLYEKRCINDLAAYLQQKHPAVLQKILNSTAVPSIDSNNQIVHETIKPIVYSIEQVAEDDIAIVGLSGLYPMAKTLQEFGSNLKNGRDCISS